MTKKKTKPGKYQSKTDSNHEITRIEDDIATFVVQWESLSGEPANEEQGAFSSDLEKTNSSRPED